MLGVVIVMTAPGAKKIKASYSTLLLTLR